MAAISAEQKAITGFFDTTFKVTVLIVALTLVSLAAAFFPGSALGAQADGSHASPMMLQRESTSVAAMGKARSMKLTFKFSAYLTNGKGSAYKSYVSPTSPFGKQAVIYKARIKNGKLYLWGSYSKHVGNTTKTYKVNGKAFSLTSKTKYYRHTGNGSFFEIWNKAKTTRYLTNKSSRLGGDMAFNIKNGKITSLSVQ